MADRLHKNAGSEDIFLILPQHVATLDLEWSNQVAIEA